MNPSINPDSMKTSPSSTTRKITRILAGTIAALLSTHAALAADATWNGTGPGNDWATGTNWSTTPVPGSGNTATFDHASGNVEIGTPVTLQNLVFATGSVGTYYIGASSQTLTLNNGGAITMNAAVSSDQVVGAALVLGTDGTAQTFTLTNNSTTAFSGLTIQGKITGSAGAGTKTLAVTGAGDTTISGFIEDGGVTNLIALTKTGTGTLTLEGFKYYNGPTTINGGTVSISEFSIALGFTQTLNIAGGTLRSTGSIVDLSTSNIAIGTGGATFEVTGTNELRTNYANITGDAGNALTKTGTGRLTLGNAYSFYEGPTIIKGGSLILAGTTLNATARVEVQSGATLSGRGTIELRPTGGDIQLLAGGKLSPGDSLIFGDPFGTLYASCNFFEFDISLGVAAAASQALLFDLGTPAESDKIVVTNSALDIGIGGLAFDDFVFTALSGFGAGTYTLFDGDTSLVGSLDSDLAHLTGSIGGYAGTLSLADGGRDIVINVVPEPGTLTLLLGATALLGWRRRR